MYLDELPELQVRGLFSNDQLHYYKLKAGIFLYEEMQYTTTWAIGHLKGVLHG